VPVIVLSALDSEDRKVLALDSGADDYVTKPFGMQELEARLRVALRHSAARDPSAAPATLTVGPIHIDVGARLVKVAGTAIELTAREFDLLAYLARNAGKVCTHRTILREVWGPGYGNETHYLRVYASRLRHKLVTRLVPSCAPTQVSVISSSTSADSASRAAGGSGHLATAASCPGLVASTRPMGTATRKEAPPSTWWRRPPGWNWEPAG